MLLLDRLLVTFCLLSAVWVLWPLTSTLFWLDALGTVLLLFVAGVLCRVRNFRAKRITPERDPRDD